MIHYPPRLIMQDAFTDMEMLQTDVMRFMAILGLCLTAIFALVQTFPQTPVAAAPAVPEAVESRLQQLQQALRAASASLVRVQSEKTLLQTDLQQARQQLQTVTESMADIKVKQTDLLDQQRRDAQNLEQLGKRLASLQLQNSRYLAQLEEARSQVRALSKARTRKTAPPKPAVQRPPSPPQTAAEARPETKARAVETDPGFTLRFASPEALEALIDRGTVGFFILQQGKAWSYRLQNGIPRLSAAPMPVSFHEMAAETVPDKFLKGTESAPQRIPGDGIWAVVLPPSLEQRLRQLMHSRNGGVLEIQSDGSVRLRGEME